MRKVRLDIDALEVESFATGTAAQGGTVLGAETGMTYCYNETCNFCVETGTTQPGGWDDATRAKYCTNGGSCIGNTCRDRTCGGGTCVGATCQSPSCGWSWCDTCDPTIP